jgi:hypothetical protein
MDRSDRFAYLTDGLWGRFAANMRLQTEVGRKAGNTALLSPKEAGLAAANTITYGWGTR